MVMSCLFVGIWKRSKAMAQDMALVLDLAIFLVFVVMAIQFNSLKHPLIIMSIVPVTGVIIGLFITQEELSAILILIRIVLNHGILLIDRVKQMRIQGGWNQSSTRGCWYKSPSRDLYDDFNYSSWNDSTGFSLRWD